MSDFGLCLFDHMLGRNRSGTDFGHKLSMLRLEIKGKVEKTCRTKGLCIWCKALYIAADGTGTVIDTEYGLERGPTFNEVLRMAELKPSDYLVVIGPFHGFLPETMDVKPLRIAALLQESWKISWNMGSQCRPVAILSAVQGIDLQDTFHKDQVINRDLSFVE